MIATPATTLGERVADHVASKVGSWPFLIIQNALFAVWMAVNVIVLAYQWDPYPFILLNLVLSFQAAETGPILLISANRAAQRDRKSLLTLKAEFEEMARDHAKLHSEHKEMHEEHKNMHAELKAMHTEMMDYLEQQNR